LVTSFGRVLRVASGTKINSRRCEDNGGSAIVGVPRQGHFNNGAVSASVLREIRDLHEVIVRHSDYECRIVAGDDLALRRIGESNCCGSENKRSDKKSRGERLHDSQINRDLYFGYRNRRGLRLRKGRTDNLSKAGWSWGCVSAIDSNRRAIFVADAHRDDGQPFVVHADEKLTAFTGLESQLVAKGMMSRKRRVSRS
jgi:hypothetical protein